MCYASHAVGVATPGGVSREESILDGTESGVHNTKTKTKTAWRGGARQYAKGDGGLHMIVPTILCTQKENWRFVDMPSTRADASKVWRERNAAIMQDARWEYCLFPGGYDMNDLRQQQTSLLEFLHQHVQAYRALPKTLKKHYIQTTMIPERQGRWYSYSKERGFEVPDDEELAMKLREKMRPLQCHSEDEPKTRHNPRGPSPHGVVQDDSIMWNEEALQSPEAVADIAERISLRTMVQCLSETVEQQHAKLEELRRKSAAPPVLSKQASCDSLFSAIDEDDVWNVMEV